MNKENCVLKLVDEIIQQCRFSQNQLTVPETRKIYEPGTHTLFIY